MNRLFPSDHPQILQWAALLFTVGIVVIAVHGPVLRAGALSFDDNMYLTENALVQNPGWASCRRFLTEVLHPSTVRGYYQPLSMISLMADYAWGGRPDDLRQFHRTSLVLHTANTLLLVVLLGLLFGRMGLAAGMGLLFGLHPMTVEPVAWVCERKTLLATFFACLCLIFYVRHAHQSSRRFYLGCLLAYVLALLSKPTSLMLPVVMVLLDYWPLRRCGRQAILEKLPLFLVGGVGAIIGYTSQRATAGAVLPPMREIGQVFLVFCHSTVLYLGRIFWPVGLPCYCPFPDSFSLSSPVTRAGVMVLGLLLPVLLWSWRWTRGALTGWLIFLVALLPTMNILHFTNVIISDKHAYLPFLGFLTSATALVAWLLPGGASPKVRRYPVVALIIVLLAGAEAVAARRCLSAWQNTIGLHQHLVARTPDAVEVHSFLGVTFLAQGNLEEARQCFERAVQIDVAYAPGHYNLGLTFQLQGRRAEAAACFREAFRFVPTNPLYHSNLGAVYLARGEYDKAFRHYRLALRTTASPVRAYHGMGLAAAMKGQFREGTECLRRALELDPHFVPGLRDAAWILAHHPEAEGRGPSPALGLARQAAELTQYRDVRTLAVLAAAYAAGRQFDAAVAQVERALALVSRTPAEPQWLARLRPDLEAYQRKEPLHGDFCAEGRWLPWMDDEGQP